MCDANCHTPHSKSSSVRQMAMSHDHGKHSMEQLRNYSVRDEIDCFGLRVKMPIAAQKQCEEPQSDISDVC